MRAGLFYVLASTMGVLGACGTFSGSDAPADGGASADAASPVDGTLPPGADAGALDATSAADAATPSACIVDAATVAFCDSFERPTGFGCGLDWKGVKGTGTIVAGDAHGGGSFCRFCPSDNQGELDHAFTLTSNGTYAMTAWVRSGPRADASAPPFGSTQLFVYGDGGQAGRTDVTVPISTSWLKVQNAVADASLGTSELINFYTEPFSANSGQCIDVDDVVLFRGK